MTCRSTSSRRWPASRAGATVDGRRATRRTTRSPYAGCASGSRSCSPTARARRRSARSPRPASGSSRSTVDVGRRRRAAPEPAVIVVQALPKGDRGELAVEMLTEIGVGRDRAVGGGPLRRGLEGRAGREVAGAVAATAREAAKQARRSWFPTVAELAVDRRGGRRCSRPPTWPWCCTRRRPTPLAALAGPGRGRIVVVVGPEGGLDRRRARRLRRGRRRAVRLGAEVLRTSTAGVAAVAALLARTPRWS